MKTIVRKIVKLLLDLLIVIALLINNNAMITFANSAATISEINRFSIGEIGGYLSQNAAMVSNLYAERNFTIPGSGPGYVLEQAMNFHDILRGNKSKVVGGNNLENGPDRVIVNKKGDLVLVQDKFRTDPSATVREMFNVDGSLRYINQLTGKPMVYEVASDQYEYVLNNLKDRISNNKVPGITDPSQAETIVRKSAYSTKQLQNIAKAGNVDSLVYDAQHGVIYAGSAMGISFVLDYVACRMNGNTNEEALKTSSLGALKTGSTVFATYVISSQLAKTAVIGLTDSAAQVIVNSLSDDIIKQLANVYGVDIFAKGTAKAALKNELNKKVTKAISRQILSSAVLVVVLEVPDIIDILSKRISSEQFLKNLTVTMATVVGGAGGAAVGGIAGQGIGGSIGGAIGSMVPGAGTAVGLGVGKAIGGKVGGFIGGVGGALGGRALSEFALKDIYKSDAEQMYAIISDSYSEGCIDYILTEDEAKEVASELHKKLDSDKLKNMYQSDDRKKFANELLEPIFLAEVKKRPVINVATEREVRQEMFKLSKGLIFIH